MIHKIKVTQKHIDDGVQGDCLHCALSLALNDSLPGTSLRPNRYTSGYDFCRGNKVYASSDGIHAYILAYDIEKHYADPRTLVVDDKNLVAYFEGEF